MNEGDTGNDTADLYLRVALSKRMDAGVKPCGSCHYCSEKVSHGGLFCDSFCRDDFEKEQAAKRRNGKA
jgi:hypothetical protein